MQDIIKNTVNDDNYFLNELGGCEKCRDDIDKDV